MQDIQEVIISLYEHSSKYQALFPQCEWTSWKLSEFCSSQQDFWFLGTHRYQRVHVAGEAEIPTRDTKATERIIRNEGVER